MWEVMAIDILRSTNPALSLSSCVEEGLPPNNLFYGKPSPFGLSNHTQSTPLFYGDNSSRSKSAPPTELHWRETSSDSSLMMENLRGYSYELKRNSNKFHRGTSSSSSSPNYGNPDVDVERRVFEGPLNCVAVTDTDSNFVSDDNGAEASKFRSPNNKSQPSTEDHPSGSLPSTSSGRQSSSKESSEGVLVLRPNPVKTVPPTSSRVMTGVLAPSPIVSAIPFVHNSPKPVRPVALSPHQEPQNKLKPKELTITNESNQTGNKAWCEESSVAVRVSKDNDRAKEKKRQAELRRLQELQCNFPISSSNSSSAKMRTAGRVGGSSLPPPRSRRESNEPATRNMKSTPIFERLVTDEVRELQSYARMVENQNVELDKMRQCQKDLERRLQDESKKNEQLEATLEVREREWIERFLELENEIKTLDSVVRSEQHKNKLLVDKIRKKEQDIQGMLKTKYDHEATAARSVRSFRQPERETRSTQSSNVSWKTSEAIAHRSPDDHLRALGTAEKVRERNTRHLLMDFFGL